MAIKKKTIKKPPTKNTIHREIEKKFIMRRLPVELLNKVKHETIKITQYYFNINGVWNRFRIAANKSSIKYIHTIKTSISPGINDEDEKEITKKEFQKLYGEHQNKCRVIKKTRYVIKYKGLKFEIDEYENLSLVVLEVELPRLNFKFDFPKGLYEDIIYEVTGIKQFSNLNLALKNTTPNWVKNK